LQELECQANEGRIALYYADESHTCTEGYVPYGWQLEGEDVFVPSQRVARLNIFGMITRDNQYEGFTTTERMTADKIVSFLDDFSFRIHNAHQINPFGQTFNINLIRPPHYFHHLPKCIINPHLISLNPLNANNPIGRIGINKSLNSILFNSCCRLLQAIRPRNR
jgi:hypothetical protein